MRQTRTSGSTRLGAMRHARGRRPVLAAVIAAVMWPAAAPALPADPQIAVLAPTEGASVPASPNGIELRYTCPAYTSIESLPGYYLRDDYSAAVATAPGVGSDNRLLQANILANTPAPHFADPALPAGECRGWLPADKGATTPGTYYWQAWRLCTSCTGGYEVGPVVRFTVTATGSSLGLALSAPARGYGGYRIMGKVTGSGLQTGTAVSIEVRNGSNWRTAGGGTLAANVADAPIALKVGDTRMRAVATLGSERVMSPEVPVTVVAAKRWPSGASWVGAWKGSSKTTGSTPRTVSFRVTNGGRTLKSAKVQVVMLCPTPGLISPFTIQLGTGIVPSTKIAPDGRFVGSAVSNGHAIVMSGRIVGRKATGTLRMSLGGCTGTSSFVAKRG